MKKEIAELLFKLSQKEGCALANIQFFSNGSGAVQTWGNEYEEFANEEELIYLLEELIKR